MGGYCTAAEALAWLDAVEQRRQQVATVYERALQYGLRARGSPAVPILHSADTSESRLVMDSIRGALRAGEIPQMATVLESLEAHGGGMNLPKSFQAHDALE